MKKLVIVIVALFFLQTIHAQTAFLDFKRKDNLIKRYWKGTTIAFQLSTGQWEKGEITKILQDSFFIRTIIVRYNMLRNDTLKFPTQGFALTDIYAMPKKGVLIDNMDGGFQVASEANWHWLKSGRLFRLGSVAYASLALINGLILQDVTFTATQIGVTGGLFILGTILKHTDKPYWVIGKKFNLKIVTL